MKFTSHNRNYEIDKFGVITQVDHRPFVYDPKYSAIYDDDKYTRGNEILQSLRYGFVLGAHGKPLRSILDIGYGNGAFMKYCKQHVPYVYGTDVTGVFVDHCYLMPEIIKADVITFWDVLEHFPDVDFVADLPCETVCISLPYCHFHIHGKEWFDEWHHRKPDEHIRHFNEMSLVNMMGYYGWQEVARSCHEDIIRKGKDSPNILSMAFKRK